MSSIISFFRHCLLLCLLSILCLFILLSFLLVLLFFIFAPLWFLALKQFSFIRFSLLFWFVLSNCSGCCCCVVWFLFLLLLIFVFLVPPWPVAHLKMKAMSIYLILFAYLFLCKSFLPKILVCGFILWIYSVHIHVSFILLEYVFTV